jgi:hypothetical protein
MLRLRMHGALPPLSHMSSGHDLGIGRTYLFLFSKMFLMKNEKQKLISYENFARKLTLPAMRTD